MIEEAFADINIWLWNGILSVALLLVTAYVKGVHNRIKSLEEEDIRHLREYEQLRLDMSERYVKRDEYHKNHIALERKVDLILDRLTELSIAMAGKVDK